MTIIIFVRICFAQQAAKDLVVFPSHLDCPSGLFFTSRSGTLLSGFILLNPTVFEMICTSLLEDNGSYNVSSLVHFSVLTVEST